jgi:hypothetical protein
MEPGTLITGREVVRMRYSHRRSFRDQASFLRRLFLQDGDLPFTNVLTEEVLARALTPISP